MYQCSDGRFIVQVDEQTGYIKRIQLQGDPTGATWSEPDYDWGHVDGFDQPESVRCEGNRVEVRYPGAVSLTVTRALEDGALVENYRFENHKNADHFIREGEWGIYLPINGNTTNFDQDPYNTRFHGDLWCGGDVCYCRTSRFNGNNPWLLTYLTKGRVNSYSQERDFKSGNDYGGTRCLNPAPRAIPVGGCLEIELRHTFEDCTLTEALNRYPGYIGLTAEYYSVYVGDRLKLTATYAGTIESCLVTLKGEPVPYTLCGGKIYVNYECTEPGEKQFDFTINGRTTWLVANVLLPLEQLLQARAHFIAEKQQYHCEGSPLDGAYLIYDIRSNSLYYDASFPDHNAGRERIAFGITVVRALRHKYDETLARSLEKYIAFIEREMLDTETGMVYNEIHRNCEWDRLYNYPWFAHLYFELYQLKKDLRYLEISGKILLNAFRKAIPAHGKSFRCGTISLGETVLQLEKNGFHELYSEILKLMREFGDYQAEEVFSIGVKPYGIEGSLAAGVNGGGIHSFSALYRLTGEKRYLDAAIRCYEIAQATTGHQPDYHLYGNPVRYWESYWFGSDKRHGDVMPHMWEAIQSTGFYEYKVATGDDRFDNDMINNSRGVLALYRADGFASHAYHYYFEFRGIDTLENNPYWAKSMGRYWGKYFDRWSNDQDWAIVFADILENGY